MLAVTNDTELLYCTTQNRLKIHCEVREANFNIRSITGKALDHIWGNGEGQSREEVYLTFILFDQSNEFLEICEKQQIRSNV